HAPGSRRASRGVDSPVRRGARPCFRSCSRGPGVRHGRTARRPGCSRDGCMSAPRDGSGGSGESEPNRAGSHAGESTKKAGKDELPPGRLQLAAIGLEAEFSLVVDGRPARPERVFGDPRSFLGGGRMHRVGTSYHLNTGGAVYFDTGVIEVATPVIEIARGCAARAGRSLWEGVLEVRSALDRWERSTRHDARLVGFSTHYNISFELPRALRANGRSVEDLALVLTY